MNKPSLLAAAIALAVVGCDQQTTTSQPTTPVAAPAAAPVAQAAPATPASQAAPATDLGETIATVNGKAISKAELEGSWNDEIVAHGLAERVTHTNLLDELVKREVLRQEALAQHLDSTQEIAVRLANIQRSLLAHAVGQAYLQAKPITDEMVRQEYDRQITTAKQIEFKARHILVKTEQEAKDLIKKLQAGGKFEELAKKRSSDPGSASKGGDLGWFNPQQMVAPFSKAVINLENGKYTTEPVQSDFGWHVILREESRDKTPPPFEAVKEQIQDSLQNIAMKKYAEELQAKATIVRKDPPPPVPAPVGAAPAQPASEAKEPAKPAAEAVPAAPAVETAPAKPAVEAAPAKPAVEAASTPATPTSAVEAKEAAKPAAEAAPATASPAPAAATASTAAPTEAPAHTH